MLKIILDILSINVLVVCYSKEDHIPQGPMKYLCHILCCLGLIYDFKISAISLIKFMDIKRAKRSVLIKSLEARLMQRSLSIQIFVFVFAQVFKLKCCTYFHHSLHTCFRSKTVPRGIMTPKPSETSKNVSFS